MQLPLFPLSMLLLPGGLSKLRIFEPRYQRLVSLATSSGQGFILTPATDDYELGVRCYINDFEQLEDGLLGIDICAEQRVNINNVYRDDDGLNFAECEIAPDWQWQQHSASEQLSRQLENLLARHPCYADHPEARHLDSPGWSICRWLELLPFSNEARAHILSEDNPVVLEHLAEQLAAAITQA
ncbi:LON peptidase substrate-binding domain-containing protein [Aliagarivorans marinus]|uniref:LON peptidase substrate-binding domain-containing protein n=1 Tax=Aliagarivorans marinus TaxID=561965 RepID=UPI0003FE6738|nr:LON peptidase substrate-binding domain-containing protein [Aliagarivorans marinus]